MTLPSLFVYFHISQISHNKQQVGKPYINQTTFIAFVTTQFFLRSTPKWLFTCFPFVVWLSTVKPVYNDHLMGYFSPFWSSSRWPRAIAFLSHGTCCRTDINSCSDFNWIITNIHFIDARHKHWKLGEINIEWITSSCKLVLLFVKICTFMKFQRGLINIVMIDIIWQCIRYGSHNLDSWNWIHDEN